MPGKIQAYADKYLPEPARKPAQQTIQLIGVRKAAAEKLRPGTQAWLGL
jgi:aminopeptidase N